MNAREPIPPAPMADEAPPASPPASRLARVARTLRAQAGMTLVEIMVVITILGLIIGVVGVSVVSYLKDAEIGVAKAQIKNLRTAVNRYRQVNSSWPQSLEEIAKYMEDSKIPKDPWGEPYIYSVREDGFTIHSKGPDKQEGTEDDVK
jgi:general secretion pathway protein G